jgi:hypothetical protein
VVLADLRHVILAAGQTNRELAAQPERGVVKDAASYYIQASENGGEPPGRWGAQALWRWA